MTGTLFNAVMAVALVLLSWGFAQFVLAYRWGLEELERATRDPRTPAHPYEIVVLIACLDEEAVIGDTVRSIRAQAPGATVVVVDDASADRTAEIAAEAGAIVVRRELPEARKGKGPALNHGYRELLARRDGGERRQPDHRTVLCVLDADGRLSPGAISAVLARFDREVVGGVQLPVRIRNKSAFLGRMQDIEFWGMSAITQMARIRTDSVSLGGNGQFTRLSALVSVGPEPWSEALTEDLDLGLELTLRGWALDMAAAEWVSQQGVENIRGLLRQRTRWYQGHILCAAKARLLWESPVVPRRTALETTMYLITPAFTLLPWSIAFTAGLALFGSNVAHGGSIAFDGVGVHAMTYAGFWYLGTFLPPIVLGLVYRRRSEGERLLPVIARSHLQVFYAYVNMAAAWRALARIALGRHGWAKTARVRETAGVPTSTPALAGATRRSSS